MGRHSDPDPRWFRQSLALAAAKALLAVAVVGLGIVGLVRWAGGGGDELGEPAETALPLAEPLAEAGATEGRRASPAATPGVSDADGSSVAVERAEADDNEDRPSVQVLNGSGDEERFDDVVRTLESLGYEVAATGRAARRYEETTIFWSAGFQDEARELRREDARFIAIEPNERLDRSIALHVVVGADWEPRG